MDAGLVALLGLALLLIALFVWLAWSRSDDTPGGPFEPDASVEVVAPAELGRSLRESLAGGSVTPGGEPVTRVVWTDLGDEVLVHLDSISVEVREGLIMASLDLEADQTGRQTMKVPFALGGSREEGAAIGVTEDLPLGHPGLAARWGKSIQASLWSGVLDSARERAGAVDGVPGRVWAERGQVFFEASKPPRPDVRSVRSAPSAGSR